MANFSERVTALRKEQRYKQREMAEIFDISLTAYQAYEYQRSYPDVPGLVRLADFFNVSLDYLMGRSDVREVQRPVDSECQD